jgi:hypothetical protein
MRFHKVALFPRGKHALLSYVCCPSAIIAGNVEEFKSLINSTGSAKNSRNTEFGVLPDAITTSNIENPTRGFGNLKRLL